MRKNQIVPGTIYARHSSWGEPQPVQLLAGEAYVIDSRAGRRYKAEPGSRLGRNRGYSLRMAGYPALVPAASPPGGLKLSREEKLALMKGADPAAELARWLERQEPSVPGTAFELVSSLTPVNGEYESELAAWRRNRDEAAQARRDANAQRSANLVRSAAALNALKAAVVRAGHPDELKAWRADQVTITLYVEDVELITGLIVTRENPQH